MKRDYQSFVCPCLFRTDLGVMVGWRGPTAAASPAHSKEKARPEPDLGGLRITADTVRPAALSFKRSAGPSMCDRPAGPNSWQASSCSEILQQAEARRIARGTSNPGRSPAAQIRSRFCVFGLADYEGPLNAFERDPIRVEQEARA